MPLPEAIIFDYGSVLEGPLDEDAFQASLAALAHEYGFEKGLDLWYHLYVGDVWEQAKRGQISREAFWEDRLGALGITAGEGRRAFKARLFEHRGLRPGMRELLGELRGRYHLAVMSNTSRRNFGRYLVERRGLDDIFEVVVSSAEIGAAKPEAAIYRVTLERLNIQPGQALFIDDLARNTRAAEALGIPSVVFTSVGALRAEFERRGIL
jgi:HAD superfamily hydrolase (TIGR01509 family)